LGFRHNSEESRAAAERPGVAMFQGDLRRRV